MTTELKAYTLANAREDYEKFQARADAIDLPAQLAKLRERIQCGAEAIAQARQEPAMAAEVKDAEQRLGKLQAEYNDLMANIEIPRAMALVLCAIGIDGLEWSGIVPAGSTVRIDIPGIFEREMLVGLDDPGTPF
jgi:hypothetical protein